MKPVAGIDFFDLDHTLIAGSSAVSFLLHGIRGRVFPVTAALFVPLFYVRYRLGLINPEAETWSFSVLHGISRPVLEEVAREGFRGLRERIYPQARALIAARRARGREVVLATSSIAIAVRPLAEELGITEVIASRLELQGERCTGRFVEPPLLGQQKKRRVLGYLDERGVQPEACGFYTDSISDLPLLEAVGEPVAVNPDPRLRRLARSRGWSVLRFRL
ncbi:MAG: HAD-IB family hydrolase [Spirochaetales bacterium]|nr:HAD-IB family hydrolase [Spirochaetales bacterium]